MASLCEEYLKNGEAVPVTFGNAMGCLSLKIGLAAIKSLRKKDCEIAEIVINPALN